jgi:nuclease S1
VWAQPVRRMPAQSTVEEIERTDTTYRGAERACVVGDHKMRVFPMWTAGCLLALIPQLAQAMPPHAGVRWWDLGHRIVARIGEQRLTPRAREAVREILAGQSLEDASVWADNIRNYRHDADKLHYVNIPLAATAYDSARDCPSGRCIIAAIAADRRVLADPTASALDRAEALRFLVHFMGDLHQPLHVADNSDRGGNRRMVYLEGDSTNLHKVWDGELLERQGVTETPYFEALRREMDTLDLAALERGSVVDWAMEGHRLAADHAYRVPRGGRLGDAYIEANRPIIDHALIAAGVRLAKVLNEALADYRPSPGAKPLGAGTYTDRESAAHVGETATVVGLVAAVSRSKSGNVYVNFGADYPRQTFTAVALAPAGGWTAGLDTLVGKRVGVRGKIVSYRGRVEVVLSSGEQIVEVR